MSNIDDNFILDRINKIKENQPFSIFKLWRYRITNFKNLDNIFTKINFDTIFFLADEKEVEFIADVSQKDLSTNSVENVSEIGANVSSYYQTQINCFSFDKLDDENFYIFSNKKIESQTYAQYLKDYQIFTASYSFGIPIVNQMKNISETKNFVSVALSNIRNQITTENADFQYIYWKDGNIKYITANHNIQYSNDGLLHKFSSVLKQIQTNDSSIGNYKFDKGNRTIEEPDGTITTIKHVLINGLISQINPEIELYTPSLDENINPRWELAKIFLDPSSIDKIVVSTSPAGEDLKKAIWSAFFISNQFHKQWQSYRITDENSVNYDKISQNLVKIWIPEINVNEFATLTPKDANTQIFKNWETKYSNILEKDDTIGKNLKQDWNNVKSILAAIGHIIPSFWSYGNFDKINQLALNWWIKINNFTIPIINAGDTPDLPTVLKDNTTVELASNKYEFDKDKKTIVDIKEEWTFISQNKTFNLDAQITFPSIQNMNWSINSIPSSPAFADVSDSNFLGQSFLFQIINRKDDSGRDSYDKLFDSLTPTEWATAEKETKTSTFKSSTDISASLQTQAQKLAFLSLRVSGLETLDNSVIVTMTTNTTTKQVKDYDLYVNCQLPNNSAPQLIGGRWYRGAASNDERNRCSLGNQQPWFDKEVFKTIIDSYNYTFTYGIIKFDLDKASNLVNKISSSFSIENLKYFREIAKETEQSAYIMISQNLKAETKLVKEIWFSGLWNSYHELKLTGTTDDNKEINIVINKKGVYNKNKSVAWEGIRF